MGIDIYEIEHPNLGVSVRFKVLSPGEVDRLVGVETTTEEAFKKSVLETVVVNLRKDITPVLATMPKSRASLAVESIYHGAIMLNPGLDISTWFKIISLASDPQKTTVKKNKTKTKRLTKSEILGIDRYLEDRVIGQKEAIDQLVKSIRRFHVGLNDEERPLGVFLFAGASGVGKTHLAKELHKYLFGSDFDIVRIDCGEYQHKHENSKITGAPPGYLGYDDGGHLVNMMRKNSHTVVLIDEIEKAHPDLFHTFLRVFDEGTLTDGSGKTVSFKDAIIVMTTNLGNKDVVIDYQFRSVGFNTEVFSGAHLPSRTRVERLANEAIAKNFTPEFLNRIDRTIVFNHLTYEDFLKISELELEKVNDKLGKRGFSLLYNDQVLDALAKDGMSSVQGARRLSQIRRESIEDTLADMLIDNRYTRGTVFQLTIVDNKYSITANKCSVGNKK